MTPPAPSSSRDRVIGGFRRWFFTPPRPHGEVLHREVSFLELFYDLVYVVAIGQAAHHLAEHVNWEGVIDFAVVFGLIWFAWLNGTTWHELHGREDGRSRSNIFAQMGLVAVLAVFTGKATGEDGQAFAVVYAILFLLFAYQWWSVQRIDTDPSYRPTTMAYISWMVTMVIGFGVSAFVGDGARFAIWAILLGVGFVGGFLGMARGTSGGYEFVTASLVERFGLITIIVLGEVVIGVVDGISDVGAGGRAIAVGMAGLGVGMGMWWNYFDLLGRRIPDRSGPRFATWLNAHLPVTGAMAAAGAAMVSLVEHASDTRTPVGTAWLLGGSVVAVLLGIALVSRALPEDEFPSGFARHIVPTYGMASAAILIVSGLQPAPLAFALVVFGILGLTWTWLLGVFFAKGGVPGSSGVAIEDAD
jgi:low temperature requirement protein LtrA